MNVIINRIRRLLGLHGEAAVLRATRSLDKVVGVLEHAAEQIEGEIRAERKSLQDAQLKLAAKEAKATTLLAGMATQQERARRVASRIGGLVE